mgnify:CR=1 FL=1
MAFIHVSGPAKTIGFQKVASTAIAVGSALAWQISSGRVSQALAESTRIAGIAIKAIASTDSDFASATVIPVLLASSDDIFLADVSGTLAQANVGQAYDLTRTAAGTAQSVDLSSAQRKVATIVGFVSASQAYVTLNGSFPFSNKTN